jgi:dienelactone hydrolase
MRTKFYPTCLIVIFLCFSTRVFSQQYSGSWGTLTEKPNTAINDMFNGYIEVLPPGYNPNGSTRYPLLVFLEGQSQFGNGSPTELQSLYGSNEGMLPDIVRSGLLPNATYQFIILIPQARRQIQTGRVPAEQMASPTEVNDIINFALQNYRVDVNRVYLSGLSLGGGSTWNYAGQSINYANRLAAIVPFSGASSLSDNPSRDDIIAQANLPVWTFVSGPSPTALDPNSHQPLDLDSTYRRLAQEYVNAINSDPHTVDALITIYPTGDHNSWETPLLGGNTLVGGNTGGTGNPSNIYVWMLSKTRNLTQPVFATVDAGPDQTLNLQNGSMITGSTAVTFDNSSITLSNTIVTPAPGRSIAGIQWVRVDGNGGTINNPTSTNPTITDLKPGNYTYQLRITDDQGLTTVDNMNIIVDAPPENKYFKIEAENYNAVSGPQIQTGFIDEGPAYGLGYLGSGNSVSYNVNVPSPGTYDLYYRYNTYGAQAIQIVVNGTAYNTTLSALNAGNWVTSKISVTLAASNVIQFISEGSNWQGFNYFELAQTSSTNLPVKFVYSNAQCNGNTVNLQWKTAQEQNTKEFSIQRSTDGTTWTEIGKYAAAGQSTQERNYVFVDKNPSSNSMYRIVETDIAGQQAISTIVRSSCTSGQNKVSLYPNPNTGASTLNLSLAEATSITLQVLDIKGTVMQQKQIQLPAGSTTVPVNITNYPNGVYTIAVRYNGDVKTIRMIKK